MPEHNFKLLHQALTLDVCIQTRTLRGYTVIKVGTLGGEPLKSFSLNFRQMQIKSVAVDNFEVKDFEVNDLLNEIVRSTDEQTIDVYNEKYQAAMFDPEHCELTIQIPSFLNENKEKQKDGQYTYEFLVAYLLSSPTAGILFQGIGGPNSAYPNTNPIATTDAASNASNVIMYSENQVNAARLWIPCIDSWSQRCAWSLTFIVAGNLMAISSGRLLNQQLCSKTGRKRCEYKVTLPTSACGIALCVGNFKPVLDAKVDFVTHFCTKDMVDIVYDTNNFLLQMFECYTEYLRVKFPFRSYKQVYIDNSYHTAAPYSGLSFFDTSILHSKSIIDGTVDSRIKIAYNAAVQWFGYYLSPKSWADTWLIIGLAMHLCMRFIRVQLGENESRNMVKEIMDYVCVEEEKNYAPLYNVDFAHQSELYSKFARYKAFLVIRMVERRIGEDIFQRVLNKKLTLASAWKQKKMVNDSSDLVISTHSFLKLIKKVSGQDLKSFAEQWIYRNGCVRLNCAFNYNRKKATVEISIKQEYIGLAHDAFPFIGSLKVRIFEMEGIVMHDLHLEHMDHIFEVVCKSKQRRMKRKKLMLACGEEKMVTFFDRNETPLLYLVFDPDCDWIREINFTQSEQMYIYQANLENDAINQRPAIQALQYFPSINSYNCLKELIDNSQIYHHCRVDACYSLASFPPVFTLSKKQNVTKNKHYPFQAIIDIFQQRFSNYYVFDPEHKGRQLVLFQTYNFTGPDIMVRPNNFSQIDEYYLQKNIPLALSSARDEQNAVPFQVLDFFLQCLDYNDNSFNLYSDAHYLAALADAFGNSVLLSTRWDTVYSHVENKPNPVRNFMGENTLTLCYQHAVRLLNLDNIFPSYKFVITCSALRLLNSLALAGFLVIHDVRRVLLEFVNVKKTRSIRLQAIQCLYILSIRKKHRFIKLIINIVKYDYDSVIRMKILDMILEDTLLPYLVKNEAGKFGYILTTFWKIMNKTAKFDIFLRRKVMDVYYYLLAPVEPAEYLIQQDGDGEPDSDENSDFDSENIDIYNIRAHTKKNTTTTTTSIDNGEAKGGTSGENLGTERAKNLQHSTAVENNNEAESVRSDARSSIYSSKNLEKLSTSNNKNITNNTHLGLVSKDVAKNSGESSSIPKEDGSSKIGVDVNDVANYKNTATTCEKNVGSESNTKEGNSNSGLGADEKMGNLGTKGGESESLTKECNSDSKNTVNTKDVSSEDVKSETKINNYNGDSETVIKNDDSNAYIPPATGAVKDETKISEANLNKDGNNESQSVTKIPVKEEEEAEGPVHIAKRLNMEA